MPNWTDMLAEKTLLVSDGAWGTELTARGLPAGEAPEKWNLERPDEVRAVAAAYVEAGSDVILTNTFGGNRFKLTRAGLERDVAKVNRRGAELSREAAGQDVLVVGAIGPTGQFMVPLGTLSEEDLVACFREQAKALANGGADALVIETMTDLAEAEAAVRAAKEATSLPVVACMTFEKGMAGFATMMGVRPEQAAAELEAAGADAVGANCGAGIEDITEVLRLMAGAASGPLWAKPNAGLPKLVEGRTVYPQTPGQMAAALPELVKAGARIIGGCCGTTPDHIRLFASRRQELAEMCLR